MEGNRKKWAVYTIREKDGFEKPFWTRIGVAFVNRDGSFSVYLDAAPLDGKLHIREWKDEVHAAAATPEATPPEPTVVAEPAPEPKVETKRRNGKAAQTVETPF
jgi:hypothetical protein